MEHNVLEFEVSMDNALDVHVVKSCNQLVHDLLDNIGTDPPVLHLHDLLEIITITKFHEDVVSRIGLDCLIEASNILALDCVLIINLSFYEFLLLVTKVLSLYDFAGIKLRLRHHLVTFSDRCSSAIFFISICLSIQGLGKTMRQINISILSFTEMSIHVN